MKCPRCQAENREGARFCRECGATFAAICASCGAQVEAGSKFCDGCGAPLALTPAPSPGPSRFASPASYTPKHLAEKILTSKAAHEGERKQVTVLFADLKGSMELLADRDPEEARKILDPVLELMMEAVHRYEGTVNQVMGDGIMALFGAPLAHEDHGVRACYAALRMQESVKKYADDVRRSHAAVVKIRVGLNSGEVVVRAIGSDPHMDYTAVGQTTHLAARMEQIADPVVITPETLALAEGYVEVKSLGPVPVKGLADPVEVYEVTGAGQARTCLQASARRGLTRFVGRDTEVEQLRRAQQLAGAGRGQIAAVVGEAGVGKSRLVYEFTHSHRLKGWLVLESASVSYGKATSYLPVIDLLKAYFKIQDRDDLREIRAKACKTKQEARGVEAQLLRVLKAEALQSEQSAALPATIKHLCEFYVLDLERRSKGAIASAGLLRLPRRSRRWRRRSWPYPSARVTARDVYDFRQARLRAGAKPSTINRDLRTLRAMLKQARPDFKFPGAAFLPEDETRVRWFRTPRRSFSYLRRDAAGYAADPQDGPSRSLPFAAMARLAALTLMRQGEIRTFEVRGRAPRARRVMLPESEGRRPAPSS